MDRYEAARAVVDQAPPQGHYNSLKYEHRKAIDDASKLLLSGSRRKREDALRVLMRIYDNSRSCNYHKVRICSILADRACEDLVNIELWAFKCIDSCRHIIVQEGLSIGSNSREAFEDLIDNAQAVLRKVREDEAKQGQGQRETLAEELSGKGLATYQNYELEREGLDIDDGDDGYDDEGGDDMEIDGEEYFTDGEEEEDDEGEDSMDEDSTDDSTDDIERALLEELDKFERQNEDTTALESRITRDPNYEEASQSERSWEVEVSEAEEALIGQFVYMLKIDRQATEWALQSIANAASYDVLGVEFEPESQVQLQGSQAQTQTQAQAQFQPPQLQLPPAPALPTVQSTTSTFVSVSISIFYASLNKYLGVKLDEEPVQSVQDNASEEPDAAL